MFGECNALIFYRVSIEFSLFAFEMLVMNIIKALNSQIQTQVHSTQLESWSPEVIGCVPVLVKCSFSLEIHHGFPGLPMVVHSFCWNVSNEGPLLYVQCTKYSLQKSIVLYFYQFPCQSRTREITGRSTRTCQHVPNCNCKCVISFIN